MAGGTCGAKAKNDTEQHEQARRELEKEALILKDLLDSPTDGRLVLLLPECFTVDMLKGDECKVRDLAALAYVIKESKQADENDQLKILLNMYGEYLDRIVSDCLRDVQVNPWCRKVWEEMVAGLDEQLMETKVIMLQDFEDQ